MIHDSSLLRCTMRLAGRSLFEDAARNPVSTAVAVAQALLWFFALPALAAVLVGPNTFGPFYDSIVPTCNPPTRTDI